MYNTLKHFVNFIARFIFVWLHTQIEGQRAMIQRAEAERQAMSKLDRIRLDQVGIKHTGAGRHRQLCGP
jgi:hypothetical protein